MAQYYFHVMNGQAVMDDTGMDLANMELVRTEAIRAAGQMLSDGDHSWKGHQWQMIVTDAFNTIVFGVSFSVDRHGL